MADSAVGLRRLFFFDAVCREGGICQAAEAIGMTQPAVSQAIKKLESSYGATLFARGHGGSELTPEGELLHRRVRRMFDQMEAAIAELPAGAKARTHSAAAVCRHLTDAQLRCHIAIARLGSAVDAARELDISQVRCTVPRASWRTRSVSRCTGAGCTTWRPIRRAWNWRANSAGAARNRPGRGRPCCGARLEQRPGGGGSIAPAAATLAGARDRPRAQGLSRRRRDDPRRPAFAAAAALQFGAIDVIVGALRSPRLEGAVTESELFVDP